MRRHRSFGVTAAITTPESSATQGVLIAQGGRFGNWPLYVKHDRLEFAHNALGMQEFVTEATEDIPAGAHQLRAKFAYDGRDLAKGGDVTLDYDGSDVGSGRVDLTQPVVFSAEDTADIVDEYGTPVSADYLGAGKFNGRIEVVQIDVSDNEHSHLIDPAEVARGATSRQ